MPVYNLSIAACEYRDLESELPNARAHAIDGGIVLAGIAGVEDQPVDGPDFGLLGRRAFRLRRRTRHSDSPGWQFFPAQQFISGIFRRVRFALVYRTDLTLLYSKNTIVWECSD
jgi:hypothetical protein